MDTIEIIDFGNYELSEEFVEEAAEKGLTTDEYLRALINEL